MADLIQDEIALKLDATNLYTDSKVVLGYICNETKQFYAYVHNRVQRFCQSTKPEQWHFLHTEEHPANQSLRSVPASQTSWFTGPSFLSQPPAEKTQLSETFELIDPERTQKLDLRYNLCYLPKLIDTYLSLLSALFYPLLLVRAVQTHGKIL